MAQEIALQSRDRQIHQQAAMIDDNDALADPSTHYAREMIADEALHRCVNPSLAGQCYDRQVEQPVAAHVAARLR